MGASRVTPHYRAPIATTPLLQVRNLDVCIRGEGNSRVRALEGINFDVHRGETLGLFGESGAGKTTLAMAILRLLPASSCMVQGSIEFEDVDLLALKEHELQKIRGSSISVVYQDSSVLNPVLTVGDQIAEVLRAHFTWRKREYKDKVISLLQELEMPDAERIYAAFPHQLSGGQRQRIALAQALACQPALVIADEPTASLDPNTTSEMLELFTRIKQRFCTAFLVISHDYVILTAISDRIMIMNAGRIVEQGSRSDLMHRPLHPYTRALFKCALLPQTPDPREARVRHIPLIEGQPPDLSTLTPGCDFAGRCPERMNICRTRFPREMAVSNAHTVSCFKYGG